MMLGALLPAGSMFSDAPLTAADFQFSNALAPVNPTTGLPAVAATTVTIAAPAPARTASTWILIAAAAAWALWRYWPQINREVHAL